MNFFQNNDLASDGGSEEKLLLFLPLYNRHYRHLLLFTKTLLPVAEDAEDIMQDVSLALWKKFDSFKEDTSFTAWSFKMIRLEVLNLQRKRSRERRFLDEDFVEVVAGKLTEYRSENIDRRYEALLECTKSLTPRMRKLIFDRYYKKKSIEDISSDSKQTPDSVYQSLCRIRKYLKECVLKKINDENNQR